MPVRLIHATVVGPEIVQSDSSVTITDDGLIGAIDDTIADTAEEIDCRGCLLVPGVVDLHCDAIETVIAGRPGTSFPIADSLPVIDTLNAAAGITTVFHALSFEEHGDGIRAADTTCRIARHLAAFRPWGLIDHRIHLRYEVTHPGILYPILDLIDEELADLASINDHSPGQGQFKDLDAFAAYYSAAKAMTISQARELGERRCTDKLANAAATERFMRACRERGIPLALHDGDDPTVLERARQAGVTICEFPITLEAARSACRLGMQVVLGAPNVVRGNSQSGNLRAIEAISEGCCDCLCADYAPWSLLHAALRLPELTGCSLCQAVATVSAAPAAAVGLHDRGRITVGQRADLVLLAPVGERRRVRDCWRGGEHIYRAGYPLPAANTERRQTTRSEALAYQGDF